MRLISMMTASFFVIGLTACAGADDSQAQSNGSAADVAESASQEMMDHGDHEMHGGATTMDGVGHATGTVRSVGSQGDFLTIQHGPFQGGIDMGAMTMGFDIMGEVDLSGFSDGDEVAFMVKQGRDGSYRITAICDTAAEGDDCLDAIMDHQH